MNLFKRKPKEETAPTITVAEHEALMREQSDRLKVKVDRIGWLLNEARIDVSIFQDRLRRIAAQETPSANATVKRMAAIARGEEPQSRDKQQAEVGA